jgi:hypothetical protein
MMKHFAYCACLVILFSACEKTEVKDDDPLGSISIVPSISLVSVSSSSVVEFKDSLVFTVFYRDGNGDVGFESADSMSLFLTDNRVPFTESYHIPPQAPAGASIAVQGNLSVVLSHTAIFDTTNATESTTYSIQLRDRLNNWSNVVTTGPITIRK